MGIWFVIGIENSKQFPFKILKKYNIRTGTDQTKKVNRIKRTIEPSFCLNFNSGSSRLAGSSPIVNLTS
jgi:hypothetical protein